MNEVQYQTFLYFKHIKIGKEGKSACDGIINYMICLNPTQQGELI